jgi:hypothetical protein
MSKGTPHIYVSDEQFKEVETVAKRLGVTTSTIANLILQSIVSITEQTLGANRIEYLKNQPPPSATKVLEPAKLPLSVHTKREVGRLARVIQLSEEAIAMWSIHGLLSEIANINPPNRHILPTAIQNKVLEIERSPHAKT